MGLWSGLSHHPAQVPLKFRPELGGKGSQAERCQAVLAELCPKLRVRVLGAKGRRPTLELKRAGRGCQSQVLGQCINPTEAPCPRLGRMWWQLQESGQDVGVGAAETQPDSPLPSSSLLLSCPPPHPPPPGHVLPARAPTDYFPLSAEGHNCQRKLQSPPISAVPRLFLAP